MPPINDKSVSPDEPFNDDPAPQGSVKGSPEADKPEITVSRSSRKKMAVAVDVVLTFSIVNRKVAAPPGNTGSSVNSFVKTRAAINRSSEAGFSVVVSPATVAVTLLVVFVCGPTAAEPGTWSVTLKAQDAPGASVPPVKFNELVPLICEPAPQTSFIGSPVATSPESVASRSSVKAIPVASVVELGSCVSVNSSVTVSPGSTGSSVNSLRRLGPATITRSSAAGSPTTDSPPTVAVTGVVTFGYVPDPTPGATSSVMLNVHEAAAARLAPVIVSRAGVASFPGGLKSGVKVAVEPAPQNPGAGVAEAVGRPT